VYRPRKSHLSQTLRAQGTNIAQRAESEGPANLNRTQLLPQSEIEVTSIQKRQRYPNQWQGTKKIEGFESSGRTGERMRPVAVGQAEPLTMAWIV
jgi:hypothetical protein